MSEEKEHKSEKKETKIGAVIVLIISAVVFIPAGGVSIFQLFNKNKDVPVFGSYNGKKIEYVQGSDFANTASNIAQSYQMQGYDVNQMQYRIMMDAFNQTILNMAITDAMETSGWVVSEKAVNRNMVQYFSDEKGNFSQKLYNQTDDATVKSIREDVKESLTYYRYINDIFGQSGAFNGESIYGAKTSSRENDFIASMGTQKHAFSVVSFAKSDFPREEAVTYGKNNADTFKKYDLSAISLTNKDDADAVLKQLKANEITFEDAVTEKSSNYFTNSEGKITSSYAYQIINSLKDSQDFESIKALGLKEVSNVIETSRGYTIYRNDGGSESADFTNQDTIDVVVSYLQSYETGYIEDYYINIAKNFKTDATVNDYESACTKYNLLSSEVAPFPLNYANSAFIDPVPTSYAELASLNTNVNALKTMFNLSVNEISDPFILDSNIVVAKCTDIIEDKNIDTSSYTSSIEYIDQSSAQQAILTSDKVENNFMTSYFQYFIGNN